MVTIRIGKWNEEKEGYTDTVAILEYRNIEEANHAWEKYIAGKIKKEIEGPDGQIHHYSYQLDVYNECKNYGYSSERINFKTTN